jgi:hypothetical protein
MGSGYGGVGGGGGSSDASAVTFTPTVLGDWTGSADPGETQEGLDQLASRTAVLEAAGGGSTAWDWADSAPTLAAGDWAGEAYNGGGSDAGNDITPTSILGGAGIRVLPPAVNDVWWINQSLAAGDFVVGFRIALLQATTAKQMNVMPTWDVTPAFLDGTDPTSDTTYVCGRRVPVSGDWTSGSINSGGTSSIFSDPSWVVGATAERGSVFDVFLSRTSTTLSLWYTSPGGLAIHKETFAVTAGAGQVGVRLYAGGVANHGFAIMAFDPAMSDVPGME